MSKLSDAQAISVLILKWVLAQIKLNSVWDLRHRDYQCYQRFYANFSSRNPPVIAFIIFKLKKKDYNKQISSIHFLFYKNGRKD